MGQKLGRFIDGPPGAPRAIVERRIRRLVIISSVLANVVGSLVVLLLATVVLPDPEEVRGHETLQRANVALFFGYASVAIAVGVAVGLRVFRPMRRLFRTDRTLTEAEQRLVLRSPLLLMKVHGVLWGFAAVGWAGINLPFSPLMAVKLGLTVLLGGLTTCMIVHLVAERLFRPAAVLALTSRVPAGSRVPGVVTRSVLAWGLGTAVPVIGILLMGAASLSVADVSSRQLSWTMVALSGTALVVGVGVIYLAARAVADPIDSVRLAMARVERQDLLTEVPVYDGSEIGQLQAGFNQMVAGLREHELLQDLFGRQVGEDVARLALERGVELGGEVRDVAVIFVDLVGSTRLAATRPPAEVVALLNEFFAVVVQVVNAHGGWINKFEGDAALAIFGAPLDLPDGPARALAAARELASRLAVEVPSLTAAVGVSAGPAVAGHIGAEKRFEYTVIGDPVNEAARLTELAKKTPGLVLASGPALDAAGPDEASHWEITGEVTLRGRLEPTRLAAPRSTSS
ncbi:adenylate/guanylate cyclase domain-containing protein [Spirillospora albida]|uniref:adenylate/guanylate cyclase domain-containing protein n=1 Tax=Spirillospora albida TaxID=58123 RepID=UPI00068DB5C8|nr:adenylate/guanylate cyclase domain-containing protein [Spirillospora albida]